MELDERLHKEIIGLSERKMYKKWFDELSSHMQRVRYLYEGNALKRSAEGHREHEMIVRALRARKVDDLRERMLVHTRRSRAGALEILERR